MMHVLYAMEENALRSFISTKEELYQAQKTMSADAIKQAKAEILSGSSINSYDPESDNIEDLYSIDSDGNAHIWITGMLTPKADVCSAFFGESVTEYGFIQQVALSADNNPKVSKKIIFHYNTNGGRVDGVDETSQVLANLKKPTLGINHGAALSAGLWLISQMDEIEDATPTSLSGSLGVAIEFIDRSEKDKAEGFNRIVLTSTDAPEKRVDITKDDGKKVIVKELDDIHEIFAARVIEGRSRSLGKILTRDYVNENFGKGGVLISSKAVQVGLSDRTRNGINLEMPKPKKNQQNKQYQQQKTSTHIENNTATAENNKRRFTNMSLKQFISENPTAKAEFETELAAAKLEGKKEAHATFTAIEPFLNEESNYPPSIMKLAFSALKGDVDKGSFLAAAAAYDGVIEKQKSDAAKLETEQLGDTKNELPKGASAIAQTVDDVKALAEQDKGAR